MEELPFLIPLFGRNGVVNATVAKAYSTALWLYDLTGGLRIGKRHRRITREEALRHLPSLRADRVAAAFLYYDARTDDARLTLALARTAALDHGAVAANHVAVDALDHDRAGTDHRGAIEHRRTGVRAAMRRQRRRGVGRRRARTRRAGCTPTRSDRPREST